VEKGTQIGGESERQNEVDVGPITSSSPKYIWSLGAWKLRLRRNEMSRLAKHRQGPAWRKWWEKWQE